MMSVRPEEDFALLGLGFDIKNNTMYAGRQPVKAPRGVLFQDIVLIKGTGVQERICQSSVSGPSQVTGQSFIYSPKNMCCRP